MEKTISKQKPRFYNVCWLGSLMALFLCLAPIATQAGAWDGNQESSLRENLDLYGGELRSLSQGPDGILYAAIQAPNGLYASDDNGESWHAMDVDASVGMSYTVSEVLGEGHAVVAVDDVEGTAYGVAGLALFKTEDAGETWTLIDSGNYEQCPYIAYGHGTLIAISRNADVGVADGAVSEAESLAITAVEDGGDMVNHYEISDSVTGIANVAASPATDTFYLLAYHGESHALTYLYESTDAGQTWTDTGLSGDWSMIGVNPNDEDMIVLAGTEAAEMTTAGVAGDWEQMGDAGFNSEAHIVFTESGRIFIGDNYTDDYENWYRLSNSAESIESTIQGDIILFDRDYATTETIWTDCTRGICRSDDDGLNWEDKVTGMNGVTVYDIDQDATKEIVWLAAYGGFAKSENFASSLAAGETPDWTYPIAPDADEDGASSITNTETIWVDDADPNTVIAVADQVYRSEDGGESWVIISVPTTTKPKGIVEDEDNDLLYGLINYSSGDSKGGGVIMSNDQGESWTDLEMNDAPANDLAIDSNGNLVVGVGDEFEETAAKRGLYYYDGSSWSHLSEDSEHETYNEIVNAVLYLETRDVMVAATGATDSGAIYVSTDSEDWSEWSNTHAVTDNFWGSDLAPDPVDPDLFFASSARPEGAGQIYKCSLSDVCGLYYTGLVGENFNTLFFDGLLSGSNLGVFSYSSKSTVTLKKEKKGKNKYKLTARIKDTATNEKLNKRWVKFYRKVGKGKYKFHKKKKTKKDKTTLVVKKRKKVNYYQARFKPKKIKDVASYGNTRVKSSRIKIPKKK